MVEASDILFYICSLISFGALLLFLRYQSKRHLLLSLILNSMSFGVLFFGLGADWIAITQFFLTIILCFILFSVDEQNSEKYHATQVPGIFHCFLLLIPLAFLVKLVTHQPWNITLSEENPSSTVSFIGVELTKNRISLFWLMSFFYLVFIFIFLKGRSKLRDR